MATMKKTTTTKIASVSAQKAATQKIAPASAITQKIAPSPVPELRTIKVAPAPAKAPVATATTQPIKVVSAPASRPASKTISQTDWRVLVEKAAYYIAEKNGFTGNPEEHWASAEAHVRRELTASGTKVV